MHLEYFITDVFPRSRRNLHIELDGFVFVWEINEHNMSQKILLNLDKYDIIWQLLHCYVILYTHLSSPQHNQTHMHTVLFGSVVVDPDRDSGKVR